MNLCCVVFVVELGTFARLKMHSDAQLELAYPIYYWLSHSIIKTLKGWVVLIDKMPADHAMLMVEGSPTENKMTIAPHTLMRRIIHAPR